MDKNSALNLNISPARREYISRINAVQDYIEKNLGSVFSLDELATVSGFSKYHFHRIFTAITNETLYSYITRQRLEKAASFLLHSRKVAITNIALDFGFSDSAVFARTFKRHYGMSASSYRKKSSNSGKALNGSSSYNEGHTLNNGRQYAMKDDVKVDIIDVSEMTVIYLRHSGSYLELGTVFPQMIEKLFKWGFEHGVMKEGETKLLAIYHDNPEITEDNKRRTSIGITVPDGTKADGQFGSMTVSAGKYAVGHFIIDKKDGTEGYSRAWSYMFGEWLPESGYLPDDNPPFEAYVNDPGTHPERKQLIDIYIPVKQR